MDNANDLPLFFWLTMMPYDFCFGPDPKSSLAQQKLLRLRFGAMVAGGVVIVETKLEDGSRQVSSPMKFKASVSYLAIGGH